jgi:EmrB/QacA subfamily drug resistance transporter
MTSTTEPAVVGGRHRRGGADTATDAAKPTRRGGDATVDRSHGEGAGGTLSHRQIILIFVGLMAGLFLAALDQTIVSAAIRVIGDDLHGLSVQAWVTTAYLITSTITTPLYGKLSDIYGRRQFFLLAIGIFVVGSAASSFATSMYMLAGFRAFQGLGAGGLFSLALTIIGDIVPPRQRAKYQGYFLAVFGTSSVLGPVLGGLLSGQSTILGITGWRWVFLVNVPIGFVAFLIVQRTLHIPHTRRDHRIDWPGALALVVGLVPLLTVAEQGRTWGWGSPRSLACYVIAAIGIVAWVLAERRIGDDALIPLRFFRDRTFSLVTVISILVGAAMFGAIALLPLYLQIVKGYTPTGAGLALLPFTAGIMVGSIASGQLIARTGRYRIFPVIGVIMLAVSMGLFISVGADTPLWRTDVFALVFGLGLGNLLQPLTLAVQNTARPTDIGAATSSATFFRQMGATLGTAVFLSVLYSTVGGKIASAFTSAARTSTFQAALATAKKAPTSGDTQLINLLAGKGSSSALNDTSFLSSANKTLAHPFDVGFSQSMDIVFAIGLGVLVLAFVFVMFLKEVPLRTQSGVEARAEAEAEAAGQSTTPTDAAPVDAVPVDGDVVPEAVVPEAVVPEVAVPEVAVTVPAFEAPEVEVPARARPAGGAHVGTARPEDPIFEPQGDPVGTGSRS